MRLTAEPFSVMEKRGEPSESVAARDYVNRLQPEINKRLYCRGGEVILK